jgi:hypothetical protein
MSTAVKSLPLLFPESVPDFLPLSVDQRILSTNRCAGEDQ